MIEEYGVIDKVEWSKDESEIIYSVVFGNGIDFGWYKAQGFKTYKEKMEEKAVNHVFGTEIISFDIAQRDKYELDLQGKFKVVLREGKYYVERIKPQYPKTYEKCCDILEYPHNVVGGYKAELLSSFQNLIICRDAYWKIAGEQMGLGKSWEPDWEDTSIKYCIEVYFNTIKKNVRNHRKYTFAFPTAEMRDAFYEDFKELIELCKELL